MSNPDSFIDEVTEEVRRDRVFRVLRRYGWIGVVGVVALVGGAAWNEWQKADARARAEALGDAVLTAIDAPDPAARAAALADVVASGDGKAMVALIAAAEAAASPDPSVRDPALARLLALSEDAALSPIWREMAAFRRLSVPGAGIAPAERSAGLQALAQPGRPFRVLAQEQLAIEKLAAGDRDGALADFRALGDDPQAPSALRARAAQMIVILGGDASPAGN